MECVKYNYYFKPRFRDTDAYAVVHHSNYFSYFEEARYEFSRKVLGFKDDILDSSQFKFPVLEAECKYRKAIQYDDDTYYVQTEFAILDHVKIEFKYNLKNNEGKVYAIGKTIHAFVESDGKMCVNIEEWFSKHLGVNFGE